MSPDIRLQRWFDAPSDVVFDAYTDPDVQRTLRTGGPDRVVESECDLRVGGEWIIRFGPASAPYVERNRLRTLLTLTQQGLPSGDVEREFKEGWNEFLDAPGRIQTRPAT